MWGGVVVGWQKDGRLAGESAKELLSSLIYLTKDCAQSALVGSPETLTEREREYQRVIIIIILILCLRTNE